MIQKFRPAVVAELVNALYSLALYPYSKVEGSNPGAIFFELIN